MSKIKNYLILLLIPFTASKSFSQDVQLLDSIPTTKEGFVKSEPAVINTINWIESTPMNQDVDTRKQIYATLLAWITNSPTLTITLDQKTTPFIKKNSNLLIVFMGGWTKYALQNSYSEDAVKCNLAGIKSAIKVYQMGNGMKKDKEMEKLIEMDSKNELESWVTSQLAKKN